MIDQDLKDLLTQLMVSQAETARELRETARELRETDRRLRESKEETDRRLRESKEETDRRLRESKEETDRQMQETDRRLRESKEATDRELRETASKLREVGQQLGKLGDKFGSFTEGMALPSMRKLLAERFGLDNIAPRYRIQKNGRTLELDVFGFSNTDRNVAVVVEVKSHLREEGIEQLLRILGDVPDFMLQHRGKKLYGILAAVDMPDDLRDRVLKEGLYLARLSGDTFELQVPDGFVPRSFQSPPAEA